LITTLLLLAGLVSVPVPSTAAPSTAAPSTAADVRLRDAHGIHVEKATRSGRLVRVTVTTKALERPVRVNVLLPTGYDGSRQRYPSYYLFHGTSGGADDWLEMGGVRSATRGRDVVTVMPDAGYDSNGGSWFTDWLDQDTELGTARWETFHTTQLVPWVDANFRTVRDRSGRAIAGLSQGGFGSYTYAARHPDLFVAAASFSGAPDIARNPVAKTAASAVISAIMTGQNGVQPYAPFGDPTLDDIVWQGHNPATIVGNLRHTDLQLWAGNGEPGPYDDPAEPNPAGTAIERFTYQSTTYFADAATEESVPFVLHDYGAGTHTWPYWARDLRQWLPHLERVFAQHRHDPRTVGYRSIEKRWTQWGWRVRNNREERFAWSGLSQATQDGFTFEGGPAIVTTPAGYRPGATYTLGYAGGSGPAAVVADERGRLRVDVRPEGTAPMTVTVGGQQPS
jgi:S-formylglutathione hydrolase FrmB